MLAVTRPLSACDNGSVTRDTLLKLDPSSNALLAVECSVGLGEGTPLRKGNLNTALLLNWSRSREQGEGDGNQSGLVEHVGGDLIAVE